MKRSDSRLSRFNRNARLDPSQVSDRRGGGGAKVVGGVGGGIGILVLVVSLLLGVDPFGGNGNPAGQSDFQSGTTTQSTLEQDCQTGADANERQDCRIVAYVNSIQQYWTQEFAARDMQYQESTTVLFSGSTQSGCGFASSQTGPFYCPADNGIYVDLEFFDLLTSQLGAQGGPFAEAYVLAHEYGHHIQNLTGVLSSAERGEQGPDSDAVAIELQADCYAGVWAHHAEGTEILQTLTQEDIDIALDAAATVGDDHIQQTTQGDVQPETWTHGSSEQRQQWFLTGYDTGDPAACDTFSD
jgi:uncharacterized protein